MRKPTSQRAVALKHGFRSGLEDAVGDQIASAGLPFQYEQLTIEYEKPARKSKYTPDFRLPNGIIIETKGHFKTDDRHKHLLIKVQHPHLDIRFVFSTSRAKIAKGSPISYAMWCEKHGFLYADKRIPKEWLAE